MRYGKSSGCAHHDVSSAFALLILQRLKRPRKALNGLRKLLVFGDQRLCQWRIEMPQDIENLKKEERPPGGDLHVPISVCICGRYRLFGLFEHGSNDFTVSSPIC
jgi:hypothetical protein